MRKMLLSFKADVYKRVLSGEKIFEHRKVFPDEPIMAYLYVSSPKQVITGKMILTNKEYLEDWKDKYKDDVELVDRINEYLKQHKCVMQIIEFQETSEIKLSQLRLDIEGFVVPQMYYYLDGTPLLEYIENNLEEREIRWKHNFERIDKKYICNG